MMQRTNTAGETVIDGAGDFRRGSSTSPEIEAILSGNRVSTPQLSFGGGIPQLTMGSPGVSGRATQQVSGEELIAANRDHLTFGPEPVQSHGSGPGGRSSSVQSSALYGELGFYLLFLSCVVF